MLQPVAADDRTVATLVTRALAVLDHDPNGARLCLDRLASLVADRRNEPAAIATPSQPRGGLTSRQLRRVTDHIEVNLAGPIRFTDAFKASTGETPHAYIIGRRVQLAQRLMLETDEPLCQIACTCGFSDQAHLTRLFGRTVGQTPMRWRKAARR